MLAQCLHKLHGACTLEAWRTIGQQRPAKNLFGVVKYQQNSRLHMLLWLCGCSITYQAASFVQLG